MRYFAENTNLGKSNGRLLPVFHSCDAYTLKSILFNKRLLPSACKVFSEDLLYLFYGRPAYKKNTDESSRLGSMLPICFILNSEYLTDVKRIAPFDTGAFFLGLYNKYLHHKMDINSFLMKPDLETLDSFIDYFFGDLISYYEGKPKHSVSYDPLDFEVESYFSLIKGIAAERIDDRKASIEVQLGDGINLHQKTLKAVVLPKYFMASKIIEDTIIDEFKAEILTYECYGVPSDHYYTQILDLVRNFLGYNKEVINA